MTKGFEGCPPDDGGSVHASVQFMGQRLDPVDVTRALRLPHDHAHRDGEPRLGRDRRTGRVREYAPHRGGLWSMSSRKWVDSPRLDDHVCWLLDQLEERRSAVTLLLVGDVHADIFCYSFGPSIAPPALLPETVERARALGIPIEHDHYPQDSEDGSAPP